MVFSRSVVLWIVEQSKRNLHSDLKHEKPNSKVIGVDLKSTFSA